MLILVDMCTYLLVDRVRALTVDLLSAKGENWGAMFENTV